MIGDYNTTETVHIPFNTFTSDDPSASVTITNLAAGDIHIHKDGAVTQRSSSAGVTISVDFDGITGNHMAHIDLSDNTDAGFYAVGSTFQVRIEGTTVDAGTINAWIGTFSIDRTLRPTVAGRTLDIATTGEAGLDFANSNGTLDAAQIGADAITAAKIADNAFVAANFAASSLDGKGDWNTVVPDAAGVAGTAVELAKVPKSDSNVTFNATALASINAEVVDTLNVDTYAEPGQGAPPATASVITKINYIYKAWRNKKEQTATEFSLYNDAGAVVDQKATVSDDATTATVGEIVTGA